MVSEVCAVRGLHAPERVALQFFPVSARRLLRPERLTRVEAVALVEGPEDVSRRVIGAHHEPALFEVDGILYYRLTW